MSLSHSHLSPAALDRFVALRRGHFKNRIPHSAFGIAELHLPPAHRGGRGFIQLPAAETFGDDAVEQPTEFRNVFLKRRAGRHDQRHRTDVRAAVEKRADRRLGVIADQRADFD